MNTGLKLTLNLLITFAIVAFESTSGLAQSTDNPKKFHWGFKLNPTFGYMHSKPGSGTEVGDGLKLGFSLGATADLLFLKDWAFNGQLNITTLNGGIDAQVPVYRATTALVPLQNQRINYAVRYLELPLAVKLRTHTIGDGSRFYLKAGIDPSLKLSEKSTTTLLNNGQVNVPVTAKLQGQLNSIRLAALAGAGYDYRFNRYLTFTSGLIVNQGLNNVSNSRTRSLQSSYLAIEFGIYF